MPISLILQNRQKSLEVDREIRALLRKAAALTLAKASAPRIKKAEISLLLTDNDGIRELNAFYRGKDQPTDVLSFPLQVDFGLSGPEAESDPPMLLGDIVISTEKAIEQAGEYRHPLERELVFLFVHGLLHLLGYDHLEKADEEKMCALQEEILTALGQSR